MAGGGGNAVKGFAKKNTTEVCHMGVSLNGGTPISDLKMIILSRKTHGCWVPPF